MHTCNSGFIFWSTTSMAPLWHHGSFHASSIGSCKSDWYKLLKLAKMALVISWLYLKYYLALILKENNARNHRTTHWFLYKVNEGLLPWSDLTRDLLWIMVLERIWSDSLNISLGKVTCFFFCLFLSFFLSLLSLKLVETNFFFNNWDNTNNHKWLF